MSAGDEQCHSFLLMPGWEVVGLASKKRERQVLEPLAKAATAPDWSLDSDRSDDLLDGESGLSDF